MIGNVLREERDAIDEAIRCVDHHFADAVDLILKMRGKVIVTGIGKSGLVGQKIAATLSSTGTSAVYMHATDAIHGDLGVIRPGDVLIAISNSGFTAEVVEVIPNARRIGAKIIALVGNPRSQLAQMADCVLNTGVACEAGYLKLAPTSSSVVTMAFGDALASVLAELRDFRTEDYATFHPGGQLGRKLLLRVRDLMHGGEDNPLLTPDVLAEEIIVKLTESRLGGVSIVSNMKSRRLLGIVTEGDIRRSLANKNQFFNMTAREIMTPDPVYIKEDEMAMRAFELMENRANQIAVLPVVAARKKVVGMIRLHDLVRIGFKPEVNH